MGLEVVEQLLDGGEDAVVVGAACQYNVAGAPALGHQLAGVRAAGVVGLDVLHATLGEQRAHAHGGGFGMAIDAAIDDYNTLFFRLVAAPHVVLADEPLQVAAPHRAVQRAYHLDVKGGGLLQHYLHGLTK